MSQHIERINNKAYVINSFKGREGWSYLPRLTKYVFPFIGFMFNENKDDSEIISQLIGLLSDENQKEVEQLLVDLVSNVEVDNMKIDFDKEFAENYDAFLLLVIQVIKLNYLESFQRLVTNLPKA
jgi:hypothetical protein